MWSPGRALPKKLRCCATFIGSGMRQYEVLTPILDVAGQATWRNIVAESKRGVSLQIKKNILYFSHK
jgi:hypothetical protein